VALNKTFKNRDGSISNGYYRVREVRSGYEKDKGEPMDLEITFNVEVYDYDTGERVENAYSGDRAVRPYTVWRPEGIGAYSLTLPDMEPVQNLIVRAYEHLKTLPEFSEATDC